MVPTPPAITALTRHSTWEAGDRLFGQDSHDVADQHQHPLAHEIVNTDTCDCGNDGESRNAIVWQGRCAYGLSIPQLKVACSRWSIALARCSGRRKAVLATLAIQPEPLSLDEDEGSPSDSVSLRSQHRAPTQP